MSWLSKLFKTEKRDTTYTGQKPVTDLRQVGGGQEYYDSISGRLRGEGVGYGEQYANQTSSPIIARMRNQFNSYDMPELKSELSAQGRRKGSGGFDQIRRAYQEQGLNESDVYANLYRENEGQKRTEINDALARMGAYASDNANLMNTRANFDYADNSRQVAEEDARRTNVRDLRMRGLASAMSFIPGAGGGSLALQKPNFSQTDFASNMSMPWGQGGSMNDRIAQRLRIAQQGGVGTMNTRQK